METLESGKEDEYDVLGGYVPSFVQHLKDTGARLGLRAGTQDDDQSLTDDAEDAIEPHTHTGWTLAEQDAFFRAIEVHSRWRPDLIAACIPTKTEWEVWMYLEALEQGATALAAQEGDEDVDMDMEDGQDAELQVAGSVSGPLSRLGPPLHRDEDRSMDEDMGEGECEPALDVSQDWIAAEERMASWIIDTEYLASLEDDGVADAAEDKPRRGRRKARKGRARNKPREQNVPKSNENSPPPVPRSPSPDPISTSRQRSRDPSTVPAWEREVLMGRLEVPHLLVLDSILREDEAAVSKSREGSVTVTALTESRGDDGATRARDGDVSSLSNRITRPSGSSSIPESLLNAAIDSVPLSSRDAGPGRPHQGQSSSINDPSESTFPDVPSQPGASDMLTVPQDNAIPDNADTNVNTESDLSMFSPRSRRRIQKRLYMRRKRALLRGDDAAPEGAVDTGIGKRKPGKKARVEGSVASVASPVPCPEVPSDDEAESPENVLKKNKPGLTLPYRLKAIFAELGIDAAYLRDQGMDLLNMGALGKLMGLYFSLEHNEEKADGLAVAESIDTELIRHLQASMVSFVTDVMHRAIVWREKEIRLKQRSRVWRHGDQITIGAVEHAVETIGARHHSHKAYFKSLEALYASLSTDVPATAAEPNSRDASVDLDVEAADLPGELPGVSTHRDVYTPVISPPSAWGVSVLRCLARTYEREATRTRRGTSAEIDEDELMEDETDEEALAAELAAEDEAEARDTALSVADEARLWAGVRGNK